MRNRAEGAKPLCGYCGVNEATMRYVVASYRGDQNLGVPYCERCLVLRRLQEAEALAASIPAFEERLQQLGGGPERRVCGYVKVKHHNDPFPLDEFCGLDYGHSGWHRRIEDVTARV